MKPPSWKGYFKSLWVKGTKLEQMKSSNVPMNIGMLES